jgi:hypothetical protein
MKPKKEPTSLTLAVYFSVNMPDQIQEYEGIQREAADLGIRPTEYMRRLVRYGREATKDKPHLLFMKRSQRAKRTRKPINGTDAD